MSALALTAAALLALAPAKKGKTEEPAAADANASVAKEFGGKVWVAAEAPPAVEGQQLHAWLSGHPATAEIGRASKDGAWVINFIAVFKKAAAKGPLTVQFFEKNDPSSLVDQFSPQNDVSRRVFSGSYELNPDLGFNKGHSYTIRVGQILNKKFQTYAAGELSLK
jgi:hypothetical protein